LVNLTQADRRFIMISAVGAFVVELGLLATLSTVQSDIEPDVAEPVWLYCGQVIAAPFRAPAFRALRSMG
jgi:hypothetical protein